MARKLPPLPYGRQEVDDDDVLTVSAVLREPFLTQGPRVAAFEERLAEVVGARHAVAFASGTAALHAAYAAAGIGPGRRVLTSPITFAATANAALYLGGEVTFADVDRETALLDLAAAEAAASDDVAVIAPVHLTGQMPDMEALAELAARRGWLVVEDAAHALGGRYRTRDGREHRVGACVHSAMCCFSFHPVKHITTGEGGAVTTNDEAFVRFLRRFRHHGTTSDPEELVGEAEGPWYYEQLELGMNYRITDVQCALGISQLRRLDDFLARRRAVAARYDRAFADVAGARPLAVPAGSRGAYHLYVIRVERGVRRALFLRLRAAGIGVQVHYIPVYRHPYYRRHGFADVSLPHAESYYAEAVSLPMYPGLTAADVDRVVGEVTRQLAEGRAAPTVV